jgi:hypothetical protein
MKRLAGDETARRELGRVAQLASQRFVQEDMADRHVALVRQLLHAADERMRLERDTACM